MPSDKAPVDMEAKDARRKAAREAAALALGDQPKAKKGIQPLSLHARASLETIADQIAAERGMHVIKLRPGGSMKASADLVRRILKSIDGGLTIEKAIIKCGVSVDMVDRWKRSNATLCQLFLQAELEQEEKLVGYIKKAAPTEWKAANWLLERRHQWLQQLRNELTGKDGGALQVVTLHKSLLSVVGGAPGKGKADPIDVTPTKAEA